ncbi:MAG: hypothetical protein K2Q18_01460, partial [Bdellovibrionales bacterium]|nr:hypothetical protein [Bdellovibrionales bacterium]
FMVYPEELDRSVGKALRQGVGMNTISQTKILPSHLKEIEDGKYVLKILEYIPQSQDFGTTQLAESVNFRAVVNDMDLPDGVKILDASNNSAIIIVIPSDKTDEFYKKIERKLPVRISYQTRPLNLITSECTRSVKAFLK